MLPISFPWFSEFRVFIRATTFSARGRINYYLTESVDGMMDCINSPTKTTRGVAKLKEDMVYLTNSDASKPTSNFSTSGQDDLSSFMAPAS